jgi:hypothetical protein
MEAKLLTFLTSLSVKQQLRFPPVVAFCLDMKQINQFEDRELIVPQLVNKANSSLAGQQSISSAGQQN